MHQNPAFNDDLQSVRIYDSKSKENGDVEESNTAEDYVIEYPCKDLLVRKLNQINKPLFHDEIRAVADAEKFANNAVIILNTTNTTLKSILITLLKEMILKIPSDSFEFESTQNPEDMAKEVFDALVINNPNEEGDFFQLSKIIQGFQHHENTGSMEPDPTWIIAMATIPWLKERMFGMISTKHPVNLGGNHNGTRIVVLVLVPPGNKAVKSDLETSRNIGAILTDINFRSIVLNSHQTNPYRGSFIDDKKIRSYILDMINVDDKFGHSPIEVSPKNPLSTSKPVTFGRGIYYDLRNRLNYYGSDYTDAFQDSQSILKTITTIFFLFFANLLPTIAFGMLNENNTNGKINITRGIIAQLIGGFGFAIFGGQHLTILLTTAPLSIIILVIYEISNQMAYDFFTFYAWVGIFNTIYLFIFAFCGLSKIMKYSTRSTEETFGLFISVAFIVDSIKACIKSFNYYYHGKKCLINDTIIDAAQCQKSESLLFLILLLGTMILALWLGGFSDTPFLNGTCRRLIADFALPVSVIFMSFVGSYIFRDVKMHGFTTSSIFNATNIEEMKLFTDFVPLLSISWKGILIAAGLAIPLSILFFMDQNISSSMVNNPANSLRKPAAYHWDLIVVGCLNFILSLFGLPWIHGAIPHSPMHVNALAFYEEHIDQSNHITYRVVRVVETRLASALSNIMVGLCIMLMPIPLEYIQAPVLYGLFLYMGLSALQHNQFFERLLLVFTEQSAYPPNHYLRRVPQKAVHYFTIIQLIQLLALCAFGFTPVPYVKMVFPLILLLQLPIRHGLLPKFFKIRYLTALDKTI